MTLDKEGGVPTGLAIVDYKTSTDGNIAPYGLQLQVYANAGRREGLDVRAAFLHDLHGARDACAVDANSIESAKGIVDAAEARIRNRDFLQLLEAPLVTAIQRSQSAPEHRWRTHSESDSAFRPLFLGS